jgi:hypothetical protein
LLLKVLRLRRALQRADGRIRNFDEVISELIDFWKKHAV